MIKYDKVKERGRIAKMAEAQEPKKSRKIGDVFSDYKTNSNIEDAVIKKMNLIKKINTLE